MEVDYAIDILKDFVRIDRLMRENKKESDYEQFCERTCIAIETVLAELDELQKSVDQIYDDYQDAGRRMFEYSDVVDEMASYIAGLDIEEDICSKTGKTNCDQMAYGECEACVKEYFRKKVKNEFNK